MISSPTITWRESLRIALEVFVASYGSTAGAAMLMPMVYPAAHALNGKLSFHDFNRIFSVPYFPVQIVFAFAVGYLGGRKFKTLFSPWVWTFPLTIFVWHFFAFEPSAFENIWWTRVQHFLGSACRPPACFDQLKYTSPLYASIAYTLGCQSTQKFSWRN